MKRRVPALSVAALCCVLSVVSIRAQAPAVAKPDPTPEKTRPASSKSTKAAGAVDPLAEVRRSMAVSLVLGLAVLVVARDIAHAKIRERLDRGVGLHENAAVSAQPQLNSNINPYMR